MVSKENNLNQKRAMYTVGYGNRSIEDFVQLLQKYAIQYLIDVRSVPYSKYNSDFSQKSLRAKLQSYDITYVFMGQELGGRPKDTSCYTLDGNVDYAKLEKMSFYQQGIRRLHTAQDHNVVLMCSELRPHTCHRSKLIGRTLAKQGIDVQHIDEQGNLRSQDAVMSMLNRKESTVQFGLFESFQTPDHTRTS